MWYLYADGHGTFPTEQYRTTEPRLSVGIDTVSIHTTNTPR